MSGPLSDDTLRAVFRSAADRQEVPKGGHFVDDEDLLLEWQWGDLDPKRRAAMLEHLAACPACRRELAAMIRARAVVPPEAAPEKTPPPAAPRKQRFSARQLVWAASAVAAALLLGLIVWSLSEPGSRTMLALGQRKLAAGDASGAMQIAEQLEARNRLDPQTKAQSDRLLEQSGYALARENLAKGDTHQVLEFEHRVTRRGVSSARLLNLAIQAQGGKRSEYTLAEESLLTQYGYELDGSSPRKSIPVVDNTVERLRKEFRQAVREHPDAIGLRLNYGQFLLSLDCLEAQGNQDGAKEQFQEALVLDDRSLLARLGLGLVEFERGKYAQALAQFEAVLQIDPENLAGHLNAAVCLAQLGRPAEADAHLRRAWELTDDPLLRAAIEAQRSRNR